MLCFNEYTFICTCMQLTMEENKTCFRTHCYAECTGGELEEMRAADTKSSEARWLMLRYWKWTSGLWWRWVVKNRGHIQNISSSGWCSGKYGQSYQWLNTKLWITCKIFRESIILPTSEARGLIQLCMLKVKLHINSRANVAYEKCHMTCCATRNGNYITNY